MDLQQSITLFSSYAYLECLFRRVRSETCLWSAATLLSSYRVSCSSALECLLLVAATVRRELQGSTDAAI